MAQFHKILIIGCGNMGGAMLEGWLASGLEPSAFAVVDPRAPKFAEGIAWWRSIDEAVAARETIGHDSVLLGFKPQQLPQLARAIAPLCGPQVSVFSLLAGIELADLERHFAPARARIRVMPNLAARIRKSPVILCARDLEEPLRAAAHRLFDQLGEALWLEDERQFDLVTALAGSGPGFVYRFIDALAEAAVELGLDRALAHRLALRTVEGASALAASSELSVAELADRVASPGGMTREGLDALDADNALKNLLIKCLRATRDQGARLARAARENG